MRDPIEEIKNLFSGFPEIRKAEAAAQKAVRLAYDSAKEAGRGEWKNDHAASGMAMTFFGGGADTDAPVFVPNCSGYDRTVAELKETQLKNDTAAEPILRRITESNFGDMAEEALATANQIELSRTFNKLRRIHSYLMEAFEGY